MQRNPASPAHIIPLSVPEWQRFAYAWAGFILAQMVVNRKAMFWPN